MSPLKKVIKLYLPSLDNWLAAAAPQQITKLYLLPSPQVDTNTTSLLKNFIASLELPSKFKSSSQQSTKKPPALPAHSYFRIANPYSADKNSLFFQSCHYISQWLNAEQVLYNSPSKNTQVHEFTCHFSLSTYPRQGLLLAELPLPLSPQQNSSLFPIKSTEEAYSPSVINELTNN